MKKMFLKTEKKKVVCIFFSGQPEKKKKVWYEYEKNQELF